MAKRNRDKHFKPARVDELRDAMIDGTLSYPMRGMVELYMNGDPETALAYQVEKAVWLKACMNFAREMKDCASFVLESSPELTTDRYAKEVIGTCKALAESDMLRLPYPVCWIEIPNSFGVRIANRRSKEGNEFAQPHPITNDTEGTIAVFAMEFGFDDEDIEAEGELGYIEKHLGTRQGIFCWTFMRSYSSRMNRMAWYDMLQGIVMTNNSVLSIAENGETMSWKAHTIPSPMPKVMRVLDALSNDNKNEARRLLSYDNFNGAERPDADNAIGNMSMLLASRVMTTFLSSLNTSWVLKEERKPHKPLPRREVSRLKTEAEKKGKTRFHRPYVLISSFHSSMVRESRRTGATRKRMVPHLRRGHVHRFWTGPKDNPEKRKLVAKYVQPTWINKAEEYDDGRPSKEYVVQT